jgi:hypothetical protein
MKTNPRWVGIILALAGALTVCVRGAETATVKSDKVNVRGQAVVTSEVITQLQKGEAITILEEVEVKKPKKGEPAKWYKIQLPANTPVWVYAPYIETTNKTVNVSRVNLRSGPGENFSVLGRMERGAPVKEIRTVNNWMEVEAPATAYAFVAAEYLDRTAGAPAATEPATVPPVTSPIPAATAETPAPQPAPPQPAPTVVAVAPEPAPVPTVDDKPPAPPATNVVAEVSTNAAPPAPVITPVPITATTPAPEAQTAVEAPPKRVVSREGRVVISPSIQAPTEYALESVQTHRLINFLHSEEAGIKMKIYGGKKVIVTGEELIDIRWTNTPILEVESIHLVP